jgi:CBS domain-containing protein
MPRENPVHGSLRSDAALLPVRIRRTLSGDAPMRSESTVHCPRRDTSLDADECFACRFFAAVVPHRDGAAIRCEGARGEPADLADGEDADTTSVQAIMTRDVVCVTPSLSLDALTTLLVDRGFGGVPVVDAEGYPVGVVSKTDLVRASRELEAHDRETSTVGDVMMPIAFTLTEQATVATVAALMTCEGVHRMPVVDDAGHVVGIVSSLDLVRWIARVSAREANLDERLSPR